MNPIRRFLDHLDRRKSEIDPSGDRRKPTMEEAKARVDAALEDLERTIIGKKALPLSANDIQRHVQFDTFADICEFRYKNGGAIAICKHKEHEAHGTNIATCNEQQCPFARGKVK